MHGAPTLQGAQRVSIGSGMPNHIVVVDTSVANYRSMIDQLGASYRYLLLDSESNGMARITDYVNEQPGFDVIRVSSHGSPLGVAVSPVSYSLMAARPPWKSSELRRP